MGIIPTKKSVMDGVKDAFKYGGAGTAVAVGRAVAGPVGGAVLAHGYGALLSDNVDKKTVRANAWMDAVVALLS